MGFSNRVIRASAGTGKTFQLSNRYLALAAANEPPDSILATTFTRKAAGEILDRVLIRLAEAVLDDTKRETLETFLGTDSLSAERVQILLETMVRRLHRLRVSTLDQFFNQLGRCFCLELGLPPGWAIAEETLDDRMRAEAVHALLAEQETADAVRLMHLLSKGEVTRSIARQIQELVLGLHEVYLDAPEAAWDRLKERRSLAPEAFRSFVLQLDELELPKHKNWAKAVAKDQALLLEGQWEDFLKGGLAKKILEGEEKYYSKPIEQPVRDVYLPLIDHARAIILNMFINQNRATRDLLARFDKAYTHLKGKHRAMRFEDITRRLSAFVDSDRLGSAFYRLDAQTAHLLLDEFQDTSSIQWRVLRPFAQGVVGGATENEKSRPRTKNSSGARLRSFFCVGDVKQAIYGWRGGVAEIFEAIQEELTGLETDTLEQSFRSSPEVIETVNRVFGPLKSNPALRNYPEAASKWHGRFLDHSTARDELKGYCCVEVAPAAEGSTDQAKTTLLYAAERIAELKKQAPTAGIGVLVRRNAEIGLLISRLRALGVEASEEGGNPLTDSPAVELLLSVLKLADHPGDTVARYHVARSCLAEPLGLLRHDDDEAAWNLSREVRRRLATDGYGRTLCDWAERVAPLCSARDARRLAQLVELAHPFDVTPPPRVDQFIDVVRRRQVESPSSADVRVMTVHKSKGLQFDIVVLPQLDGKLTGQPPKLVVGRPSPTEPIERVCRYVGKELRPMLPETFQKMFDAEQSQKVEESLCLLYVAMTRAVHALHLVVAPPSEKEKSIPSSYAGLLRSVLVGEDQRLEPETVPFEVGDPNWFTATTPSSPEATDLPSNIPSSTPPATPQVHLAPLAQRPRRGWNRFSPSSLEGNPQTKVDLRDHWRLDSGHAARRRGTILHAWFEAIEWLDSPIPDDQFLRTLGEKIDPGYGDFEPLLHDFHEAIRRPTVRETLSRATYSAPASDSTPVHLSGPVDSPRWKVAREQRFALSMGDQMMSGSIDRLTLLYDGPRLAGGDIIDYKTDRIGPDQLAERVEFYRGQLVAYRRAVSKIYRLEPNRISTRLLFLELDQTVRLD